MLNAAKRSVLLALAVALGCGPTTQTTEQTLPDTVESTGPQSQDIVHEYKGADLQGMRFAPEALEWPGVVPVKVKGALPKLDKQRKKIAKQIEKNKINLNDGHLIVTLLNNAAGIKEQSGVEADVAQAQAMRTEARDVLKAMYDQAGEGQADEVTLKRLAAIQVPLGEAEAVPYWEELVARFPDSESAVEYKTWLAYFYLRADRNADAAQLVEGWDVATIPGRSAYVVAWSKYRARDFAGANEAIKAAAAGWTGGGKPGLLRDVELIMGRAGAPVDDARSALALILPEDKPVLMVLHTYKLHEAYLYAGRYALAAEALDKAYPDAQQGDQITFRYNQADYMFRIGRPVEAAQKIKEAHDACAAWDECAAPLANAIAERMLLLARVYHNIYATSLDESYSRAAKVLYEVYLGISPERPDKAEVESNKSNLEQHIANAKPEMGKHAKDSMQTVLTAHGEAVQACYEAVLQGEKELQGTVKLTIDVNQDGSVPAVATEPAAGQEGLAAVAGCLAEEIKTWSFPSRTVPGLTRLIYPVNFSVKQ